MFSTVLIGGAPVLCSQPLAASLTFALCSYLLLLYRWWAQLTASPVHLSVFIANPSFISPIPPWLSLYLFLYHFFSRILLFHTHTFTVLCCCFPQSYSSPCDLWHPISNPSQQTLTRLHTSLHSLTLPTPPSTLSQPRIPGTQVSDTLPKMTKDKIKNMGGGGAEDYKRRGGLPPVFEPSPSPAWAGC